MDTKGRAWDCLPVASETATKKDKDMSKLFSKQGSAGGFTATGKAVVGQYRPKVKAWAVWVDGGGLSTMRSFQKASEADAFAATLICPATTERLKWW